MVTGAYYPELSGGGLQARNVVKALARDARFIIITTSIEPSLPAAAIEEGVAVYRIHVDPASLTSKLAATVKLARVFVSTRREFDIVNLHGFSQKAIVLRLLAALFGKRFVLTLQTGGHDEPAAARRQGRLANWAYRGADLYLSVSPGLSRALVDSGVDRGRLREVCNAVDTARFQPADASTRAALRSALDLPHDHRIVLFVGYFSRDKRPDALFAAWSALPPAMLERSTLVFVGATEGDYGEIDPTVAAGIRESASARGLADRVRFVGRTLEIERYYRAADAYVLPSIREGLPIALLEAMSCGLPCIASRLPGSTDTIVESGRNGVLVPPGDVGALTSALATMMSDSPAAASLGAAARATIESRYSIDTTAGAWLDAYRSLAGARG
jgi:glycosyltransferase involved in cell wall biosynthesis